LRAEERTLGAGIDDKSVVRTIEELRIKVRLLAKKNRADSLIEQYLTGREFSVAIIRLNRVSTE
jgi:D-alanine-D-alanine ligase-like ATP-grasp enzyme